MTHSDRCHTHWLARTPSKINSLGYTRKISGGRGKFPTRAGRATPPPHSFNDFKGFFLRLNPIFTHNPLIVGRSLRFYGVMTLFPPENPLLLLVYWAIVRFMTLIECKIGWMGLVYVQLDWGRHFLRIFCKIKGLFIAIYRPIV